MRFLRLVAMIAVITAIVLLFTGCSTISRLVDYGAAANSEVVEASIFTLCEGASVGAIRREFVTEEEVETWKKLCNEQSEFTP